MMHDPTLRFLNFRFYIHCACIIFIIVELCENLDNHYAIIDQEIVWHGGINLLGRPDIYDNLIRLKSVDVASELLTLDKDE